MIEIGDNNSQHVARILCVDDDDTLLAFLDFAFKKEGYDTCLMTSSDGILDVVRDWCPDVIVLDIAIKDECGLDVARELHLAGVTSHTPIMFLTSDQTQQSRYSAFLLGAMDFITKPFTMDEVVAGVKPLTTMSKIHKLLSNMRK